MRHGRLRVLPLLLPLFLLLAAALPSAAAQPGDAGAEAIANGVIRSNESQANESQVNPVQPLRAGSFARLVAARSGKPFVVALWSTTCTHCPRELRALGELKQRYPALDLVLVSTDTPADAQEAATLARGYGLGSSEQWVFAEDVPDRLRAEIDGRWHGELPRTYFYDRAHRVEAVSGVVPTARLERWAEAHAR